MKDIATEIAALRLPVGKYALIGGGALSLYGIREHSDIDLVVTQDLYDHIKQQKGWVEEEKDLGCTHFCVLRQGNFEIFTLVGFNSDDSRCCIEYKGDPEIFIKSAHIVEGVPVASLQEIRKFKEAYGREKDMQDIILIDEHMLSTGGIVKNTPEIS